MSRAAFQAALPYALTTERSVRLHDFFLQQGWIKVGGLRVGCTSRGAEMAGGLSTHTFSLPEAKLPAIDTGNQPCQCVCLAAESRAAGSGRGDATRQMMPPLLAGTRERGRE